MTFQVYEPYSNTALTFELKTRSFVLTEIAVDFHTGHRMAKACWAFLTLALMFSSMPPVLLILFILLPRNTNSLTSSTFAPSMVTGASYWLMVGSSFVLYWLIPRPTRCAVLLRALTLSCMSCRPRDSRAQSSVNSTSSLTDVHWMPFPELL